MLRRRSLAACLLAVALGLSVPAGAAAVSPVAPTLSFLKTPTDQLGWPGYASGTEVTPSGDLYTGWAELTLRAGSRRRGIGPAGRTLEDGRYPVVRNVLVDAGVTYVSTVFSAPVNGALVDFVRVEMTNLGRVPRAAELSASVRNSGGDLIARGANCCIRAYRFPRPRTPTRDGLYFQPGEFFNSASQYAFAGNTLLRDGKALVLYAPAGGRVTAEQVLTSSTTTPVPKTGFGRTTYSVTLAPGQHQQLDFRLPVTPLDPASPASANVAAASFDDYHARTIDYWRRLLAPAMQISLPEAKPEEAFYASLVNDAVARYRLPSGGWVQAVNNLRYHAFWLRDAAVITNSFDLVGLHRLAGENLLFFLTWQRPDGLFISRPEEYDGFGQTLWAFGEHVRRTGSATFARTVFPSIRRAMTWLEGQAKSDPLGLMPPVGTSFDNDLVTGHLTGDNLWALDGIQGAADIARLLGQKTLAARWAADRAALRAKLDAAIKLSAARTGGALPPSLDAAGGQDWGNLWAAYPAQIYRADSPEVSATLRSARAKYREGIATYADKKLLHGYLGFRVLQTELLRGEQAKVVQGLYDELAHTTSTHGGFEAGVRPLGDRQVVDSTVPHGWFAAEYVAMLRNMLVRDAGPRSIHLMSAIPAAWLGTGEKISVRNASTTKGTVSFELTAHHGGAILSWSSGVPRDVNLQFPVPAGVRGVKAAGLSRDGKLITLKGRSGALDISWRLVGPFPTYESTFARLSALYGRLGGTKGRGVNPRATFSRSTGREDLDGSSSLAP